MDGEEQEAESIAMKVSAARFERQAQWKDFAILYRSNHQSRILEQALRNLKIPYTIAGGQSFSTRPRCATSWPTCGCWPTMTTIRPSSARPPRPSAASARPPCRRWASTPPAASCRCWPPCRDRPGKPAGAAADRTAAHLHRIHPPHAVARGGAADGKRDAPAEPAGPILDDLLQAIQYERHLFELFDEKPAQTRWQCATERKPRKTICRSSTWCSMWRW